MFFISYETVFLCLVNDNDYFVATKNSYFNISSQLAQFCISHTKDLFYFFAENSCFYLVYLLFSSQQLFFSSRYLRCLFSLRQRLFYVPDRQQLPLISHHTTVILYFSADNERFLISSQTMAVFDLPTDNCCFYTITQGAASFISPHITTVFLFLFGQLLCFMLPQEICVCFAFN